MRHFKVNIYSFGSTSQLIITLFVVTLVCGHGLVVFYRAFCVDLLTFDVLYIDDVILQ